MAVGLSVIALLFLIVSALLWRRGGQLRRCERELEAANGRLQSVEAELRKQRQQLTHLARVSMLGELSGALAHELNQPLTSILSNAEAGQHFLEGDKRDLQEVR